MGALEEFEQIFHLKVFAHKK